MVDIANWIIAVANLILAGSTITLVMITASPFLLMREENIIEI